MSKKIKVHILSATVTLLILVVCFGVSVLLQNLLSLKDHINTVFVFGVFLVSLVTEGYVWGISSAFISTFAVNFVAYPYFAFDFSDPENVLSALVMIALALLTCGLTTRLKKWQELKAEGEREMMRANLLRAVSHDLRTPLTTIYGSVSAILDNPDSLSEEQKLKLLSGIKDDSDWLVRMVENLLSITRIDSGKVDIIKSPIVVDELIDSVISKFKKRYQDCNVVVELPDDLLIVQMDAILIEQVILNILENAIRHAKGMTWLLLRVYKNADLACFEISDDGCGIDNDRLDRIISGTYVPDQSSDKSRRNSGIGLSVCSTIIKAHGGKIEAENRNGGGAIFRFMLKSEEGDGCDEQ